MALTVQNGSLVVRDGALGTGQGCCCGGDSCATKSCRLEVTFWPNLQPVGECNGTPGCCCEGEPEGGCLHESVLGEDGGAIVGQDEYVFRGRCEPCCAEGGTRLIFSMIADPDLDAENGGSRVAAAEAWVAGARGWLEANGWTKVSSYSALCPKGSSTDNESVVYVRACCDEELICPETAEECVSALTFEPENPGGLTPQFTPSGLCPPVGFLECFPACGENPLP